MKHLSDSLFSLLGSLLSFFCTSKRKDVREFTELVTAQFGFLSERLEKAMTDYLTLSEHVRETHTEVFRLREELARAYTERCVHAECRERDKGAL